MMKSRDDIKIFKNKLFSLLISANFKALEGSSPDIFKYVSVTTGPGLWLPALLGLSAVTLTNSGCYPSMEAISSVWNFSLQPIFIQNY